VVIHALTKRGWWCGEPATVRCPLGQ
jgi:hypothetical protein